MTFVEQIKYFVCPKTNKKFEFYTECIDCKDFGNYIHETDTIACNYKERNDIIYLGLFGVYPMDANEEIEEHTARACEGTKKISDLMDKFNTDVLALQKEYADVGASDTSAREHIFDKIWNRYNEVRLGG